jgi:hypothetical protein
MIGRRGFVSKAFTTCATPEASNPIRAAMVVQNFRKSRREKPF